MAESTPAPELKTYKGNCHCGAFKFSIKIPELTSATECNCSLCRKKGCLWIHPAAECFIIEKGDGSLKNYEFRGCSTFHKFCGTCGTGVMSKRIGEPTGLDIGINVRTLQDVDLWSLTVEKFNGDTFDPAYNPPKFTGPEPRAEIENSKLYTGSCHCGAVTLALKVKGPLSEEPEEIDGPEVIGECDCSICSRKGTIVTYRSPAQISISLIPGTSLSTYTFGPKRFAHRFCPVCGVAVSTEDLNNENVMAVNLRCFEGVEWDDIKVVKGYWSKMEPKYVVPE